MAEFTPITTQDEFDSMIKSRLEREANKVRGEFADYNDIKSGLESKTKEAADLAEQLAGLKAQVSDLSTKLSTAEADSLKTRIVHEMGIPFEMKDRLRGTNEEEIRKDAEALKQFFNTTTQPTMPVFNPEKPAGDTKNTELKSMLHSLNLNGGI